MLYPSSVSYGPSDSFWANKKVFLTGHTGFKGSWLTLWLAELGAKIHGYSLAPPTSPSLFGTLALDEMCEHEIADVRDADRLQSSIRDFRPDIVMHLAAQPLVIASYQAPAETFAVNVQGTVNVLEACRKSSPRAVLVVTTDKCYLNREWMRSYSEDDPLAGDDPYGASKACAELAVRAWRQSFFSGKQDTVLASARAGNIFGGGDWSANRLIPDAARAFMAGRPLILRNPASVRPWQHVTAPLCGYLLLAEHMFACGHKYGIPFNFGPNDDDRHLTVQEIAAWFAKCWRGAAHIEERSDAPAPRETAFLTLDSSRARDMLGWRPSANIEDDLQATADLYRLLYSAASPGQLRDACLGLIAREGKPQDPAIFGSRVA